PAECGLESNLTECLWSILLILITVTLLFKTVLPAELMKIFIQAGSVIALLLGGFPVPSRQYQFNSSSGL
ncbi:MAG: hypothetical protein ACKO4S_08545, partial [Snowella sp.]